MIIRIGASLVQKYRFQAVNNALMLQKKQTRDGIQSDIHQGPQVAKDWQIGECDLTMFSLRNWSAMLMTLWLVIISCTSQGSCVYGLRLMRLQWKAVQLPVIPSFDSGYPLRHAIGQFPPLEWNVQFSEHRMSTSSILRCVRVPMGITCRRRLYLQWSYFSAPLSFAPEKQLAAVTPNWAECIQ